LLPAVAGCLIIRSTAFIVLKIVYLTHQYFPRHVGGTEVFTQALAVRAQRAGHRVRVVTHVESPSVNPDDYREVSIEHEGIPVTEIHHNLSRADNPARSEYDNPHVVEMLRPVLEAEKPDLVHAVHGMKLSGAALQLCYDEGLPVILTLTDYWFICQRHTLLRWNQELCQGPAHDLDCLRCAHETHGFAAGRMQKLPVPILRMISDGSSLFGKPELSRFWRDLGAIRERQAFLRQIVERADSIIALSDFQKAMYVRNGYDEKKIRVLQHGLEIEGLQPAKRLPSEPLELVFIGSLVYHKGVHVALRALALRPEAKVRLLIYGDASGSNQYLDSLKELARADDRVKLMGTFAVGQMGQVLKTAHALVMPALWYENEPLVVKAAQYIGLPILASNIGTLAKSVQQGVNGWLLPPGDVPAWADAIASLRPVPVEPNHSIKTMEENAREMLALYEEIYSNRRCNAPNI
jgi:glycosyltransferase involved in cell wall biosynthesis